MARTKSDRQQNVDSNLLPPKAHIDVLDEVVDFGVGLQSIDISWAFEGSSLQYAVLGAGVVIDADTGVLTVDTDVAHLASQFIVVASNTAGDARLSLSFTTEEEGGSTLPIVVYESSFQTDRSADFSGRSRSLKHDPESVMEGDPVSGAMVFGEAGEDFPTLSMIQTVSVGRSYQIVLMAHFQNGPKGQRTTFRLRRRDGSILQETRGKSAGFRQFVFENVPRDAHDIQISCQIRGELKKTQHYRLHYLQILDITETGPSPLATCAPHFHALAVTSGVETVGIDFNPCFRHNVTDFQLISDIDHSWAPHGVLTLHPRTNAKKGSTRELEVFARNGVMESILPAQFLVHEVAHYSPPEVRGEPLPDLVVQAGRPMPPVDPLRQVVDGIAPFSVCVEGAPNWLRIENSGLIHGRPKDDDLGEQTVVFQISDAHGKRLMRECKIRVVSANERSPDVILPPGTDLAHWIKNKKPDAGSVIGLEDGGTYKCSQILDAVYPPDNPLVIVGLGHSIVNKLHLRRSQGIVFKNLVLQSGKVPEKDNAKIGIHVISDDKRTSQHLAFFDIEIVGAKIPVQPKEGQWKNKETFAFKGSALKIEGAYCVVDNVTCHKVYAGFSPVHGPIGFYDLTVEHFRDDGGTIGDASRGIVIDGLRVRKPSGNFLPKDHRDLLQGYGQGRWGATQRICIQNGFLSCSGAKDVQGLHWDQDDWGSEFSLKTEKFTNADIVVRDTVILASHPSNLFLFERFLRGSVERSIILPHPDVPWDGELVHRAASDLSITKSIFRKIGGGAHKRWRHLVRESESVVLDELETTAIQDIFPNWKRKDLAFEDPREAVSDGQAPSDARLWIDPESTWAKANPDIGPKWLRDGKETR